MQLTSRRWSQRQYASLGLLAVLCGCILPAASASAQSRTRRGLLALYTFEAGEGTTIRDRSGVGKPLDLKIDKAANVQWRQGALVVRKAAKLESSSAATKLNEAIRRSGAVSVEVWIKPQNTKQDGPARIVSLSASPNERNITLGQDGNGYDARLRATSTSTNGIPSTASNKNQARTRLTHVVYTRDTKGNATLYVDGKRQGGRKVGGKLTNWDRKFRLALANEVGGQRPWLGELHMVAIYSAALSSKDVAQHFKAGATAAPLVKVDPNIHLFETKVAALLSHHCLECHDSSTRKGGLDLSRKLAAFQGGESGTGIAPKQLDESLVWQYVESDEMPLKRTPLTSAEKELLAEWIRGGAAWTLDLIDPAVYEYGAESSENWIRRLTIDEYIETVRSAVGVDISKDAYEVLPKDLRADGFSNTAYNLGVDLKHVESYAKLARLISARMDVLKFTSRFSKSRSLNTDADTRDLVEKIGEWLLRGPLEEREVTNYSGIATTVASAGGTFEEGMRFTVEAMLQSPRFIYRVEDQQGGGSLPVGEFELASRLSYTLWGGPPDAELFRAARKGELSDEGQLRRQVERMLNDPRAIQQSQRFIREWLNLNRLVNMQPNKERFPDWRPQLALDMKEETQRFFRHIVWEEKRPLADLLNAQVTFATPELARHYGLKPKSEKSARYDLSGVPGRGGLLTQGSVLTVGGDEASMVSRGLFVMHELMRGVVKDPPPCVNTVPPPTKEGLTQRGVAEGRIANKNCGGCHSKFEPLAFGLEKFDGLGRYSQKDRHGNALREDGEILFPGAAKSIKYKSSKELMSLLADSDRVQETITWKLTQFAVGRPLGAGDAATVVKIHRSAQKAGGTYQNLMSEIVMSDLVRTMQRGTDE